MPPGLTAPRIPVAGPSITDLEVRYVADAARHGWQDRAGEWPARFEAAFAAWTGTRHAIALPSCTSALHLALAALGVGPGDEVVVPDLTWIATAAPITYLGATPVFADVDPATWCLSAPALEAVCTPRTRAVIPVDLYGGMPDYAALAAVADARGIAIVEDAAEAFGAEQAGVRAGAFGRAGAFSFHGSKTLTTGEGGMLVTDDETLADRCLGLRDHGRPPGDRWFANDEVAYKYRMSAMQAAMGLAQVERADELVAGKRRLFAWYAERLADLDALTLNPRPAGTDPAPWMVTVLFDPALGVDKRAVMAALDAEGIDTRPFFHPLSTIPAFADTSQAAAARVRNVHAAAIAPWGVNLPSGLQLTEDDVDLVCDRVRRLVTRR